LVELNPSRDTCLCPCPYIPLFKVQGSGCRVEGHAHSRTIHPTSPPEYTPCRKYNQTHTIASKPQQSTLNRSTANCQPSTVSEWSHTQPSTLNPQPCLSRTSFIVTHVTPSTLNPQPCLSRTRLVGCWPERAKAGSTRCFDRQPRPVRGSSDETRLTVEMRETRLTVEMRET
jgi:hypothetical protein